MCGRFALKTPPRTIQEHFCLPESITLPPRYNIAPSQNVAAVRMMPGKSVRQMVMLHWGLIPHWAKDMKIGYRMINARAETLLQKPSFKAPYKKRRCLIPADGFYEWLHTGKSKIPYYIQLKKGAVFGLAGLWESWNSPDGDHVESCTIITAEANRLIRTIHDRMPVIISPDRYETWLQDSAELQMMQQILTPYPAEEMRMHRVGPEVNSPRNDSPECIRSIDS